MVVGSRCVGSVKDNLSLSCRLEVEVEEEGQRQSQSQRTKELARIYRNLQRNLIIVYRTVYCTVYLHRENFFLSFWPLTSLGISSIFALSASCAVVLV